MIRAFSIALVFLALLAVPALVQGQGDEPGARPQKGEGGAGGRAMRAQRPDLFGQHDLNADGQLTLDELVEGAKKLIAGADADQDGSVTREEFNAHQRKQRDERRKAAGGGEGRPGEAGRAGGRRSPEEFFNRMDTDGDGQLSLEEFKSGMGQMRRGGRGGRGGGGGGGPRRGPDAPDRDDETR